MSPQGWTVLVERGGGGQVGVGGAHDRVVLGLDSEGWNEHHTLHSVLVV